jgi:hypothetical protein
MFWKKKQPLTVQLTVDAVESAAPKKSNTENLRQAADELASSLSSYSDAAYQASKSAPDAEMVEARAKVEAARKLVLEGRMAYALGRCIPDHVRHWPSWITRDDFRKWVHFSASDIDARQHEEVEVSRTAKIATVSFTFNGSRYRVVLRDCGMSFAPEIAEKNGEIELWRGDDLVAKFELIEDLTKEYSHWEFSEVRALRVGPWMKDVIDIATQIESGQRKWSEDFHDNRTLEAAKNIDL